MKKIWHLRSDFDIMDVGRYSLFMVKLDLEEYRSNIMEGGLWLVLNHYQLICLRYLEFQASEAIMDRALVYSSPVLIDYIMMRDFHLH